MHYNISRLIDGILIENQVVADLVDLASQKKQAIILGELAELNEVMRRENHLTQALEKTETQRHAESLKLVRVLGVKEEDLTASSLINVLHEVGVPDTERLAEGVKDLAFNLERLKDLNQINATLLEQSLAFVENMEALLTRQRETTYSAGGAVKDSPTHNVLDKRI